MSLFQMGLWQAAALSAAPTAAPAWVKQFGTAAAHMDIDPVGDRAWLYPTEVAISALLACTRNSQKWVKNASGLLVNFSANALPYTNAGFVIEPAATNSFLQSQTMATANWASNTNVTVTDNAIVAPDGTTTAELFTDNNTGGAAQTYASRALLVPAGTNCISVFVKAGTISRLRINTNAFDAAGNGDSYFNLATGLATTTSANHSNPLIEAFTNGWYRCSIAFTTTTDVNGFVRFAMSTSDITTITSNGTQTFYLWQAQCEPGTRPTSVIPTTTVAVTRPADIVSFSDLSWFSGSGNSIYAEWVARNVANATVWAFDAANDKALTEQTGMSPRLADATTANTAAAGLTVSVAGRMALNDYALYMAGGTVATDTSESEPGALSASRIGCDMAGANYLSSFIQRIASSRSILSNNDLALLAEPWNGRIDSTLIRIDSADHRIG